MVRVIVRVVPVVAAVVVAGATRASHADAIASWGFESPTLTALADSATFGPHNPDSGAGSFTGVHASAATDWTLPSGNGSATSVNSNTWAAGDYLEFSVSTIGLENITISWDQTRSSNGPNSFDLQFATSTSGPFTTLGTHDNYAVDSISPVWTSYSADLSSITSLDNGSAVFRLVAQVAGVNTGGSNRIDNVVISGAALPEPTGLAACGSLALLLLTRHRHQRTCRCDRAHAGDHQADSAGAARGRRHPHARPDREAAPAR
jgi:hypothetical protein